jgi:multidrug efflux pump subunit AcrA (membrane-fusion protein)
VSRTVKTALVLGAAALCGAAVTIALRGTPAPAAPSAPPLGTASVVRTDLTNSVLTQGTLGYAPSPPVVNQIPGIYTDVLAPGSVVQPGQVLYRVDDRPVVLMTGTVPAWRPFAAG